MSSINTISGSTRVLPIPNHSRLPQPPGLISLYSSAAPNSSISQRGSSLGFAVVEDEDGVICIDWICWFLKSPVGVISKLPTKIYGKYKYVLLYV